jgi:hypothetical protein
LNWKGLTTTTATKVLHPLLGDLLLPRPGLPGQDLRPCPEPSRSAVLDMKDRHREAGDE